MAALAERLEAALAGSLLEQVEPLSFSSLKTATPGHGQLVGRTLAGITCRGKYDVLCFEGGFRLLLHLGQSGRVRLERRTVTGRPRGGVVRLGFDGRPQLTVTEAAKERRAGWWVLGPGDDGPLATLGPEATSPQAAALVRSTAASRQLHPWLRDQQSLAGIGRGYADDICHRAHLSPFAIVGRLDPAERERLVGAIAGVLEEALVRERQRQGGLEGDLGDRFAVHRRAGSPCPGCHGVLERVSFASTELVYCPHCQCDDRVLADRRLSRLLR